MKTRLWFNMLMLSFVVLLGACGGDSSDSDTTELADVVPDTAPGDLLVPDLQTVADVEEVSAPETTAEVVEEPVLCLDGQVEAKASFALPGLDGPVEVVFDDWGVPHIYASTEHDLFYAQAFAMARFRFIQMHAMRKIASGLYSGATVATGDDLANDVYMRVLNLRGVAEEGWADVSANDPAVKGMVEAYSEGVNAYIEQVQAGVIEKPLEWPLVGEITPWVPTDTMVIARLQSWDLSFGGRTDKVLNAQRFQEIEERWGESGLANLAVDLHSMAPLNQALVIAPDENDRSAPTFDSRKAMRHPWFGRTGSSYWNKVGKSLAAIPMYHNNRAQEGIGSNNWTVSGSLTESGSPMVANDTHLSLRNPSVFFEVHLNTARAGGDINIVGVCFPGLPAVILGQNPHASWGATVYYSDVTDVYLETVTLGDSPTALFEGEEVAIEKREESFTYKAPKDGCESWFGEFVLGTEHEVVEADGLCTLTVQVWEVPHHGPIIPGSLEPVDAGKANALTWKWTGFEPSTELRTAYEYLRISTPQEFFDALSHFEVGAMTWVYGDTENHIAVSSHNRIPVRKHIAAGMASDFPSFLPYPGDGCCEWTGRVSDELLPKAVDPEKGYIMSANGDVLGHTLDGDPYNDESYQGYLFYPGFRAGRIVELLEEAMAAGKVTLADMQAIQADHRSPVGASLSPHIIAAVEAAEAAKAGSEGADASLAAFADDQRILEARDRLAAWSYLAAAGALPDAAQAERDDSVATAIFNAWLVFISEGLFADKLETKYDDQWRVRFLFNIFNSPEKLATWDAVRGDSLVWDNTTTEEVESRHFIVLVALTKALDFLADPELVGVANKGGFGTDDMEQWNWGKLHTLTMAHPLGGKFNIPSADLFPEGYPRPGDNFCVDAANPGMDNTEFIFKSGPAIRNVYTMTPDLPAADTVIPGGEDSSVGRPHYADQFKLWAVNQTHPFYSNVESILPVAESCFVMEQQ